VIGAIFAILLVGLLLRRLRQPHVVAYLLAGVLLGPHGLRVFTDEAGLARFGDLGVVALLFFVGMEVSLPHLVSSWRVSLVGTALQVLASIGCVFAIGAWFGWPFPRVLLLGFAISLSSTAVVVSLLRARKEIDSETGRDALGILLVQDLALVPMLVTISLVSGKASSGGFVAVQALAGVAVLILLAALSRRESISLPFGALLRKDHELQIFAALALCFGLATATGLLGLSTAVGSFVAGVVVATARETEWVQRSLEPFRVVLVALFFVSVGMLIDPRFLVAHWGMILALVAAVFVTNWLVNTAILRALGRTWRHSLYVGVLLSQIGEFSFVLAAVGRQVQIITDFAYQATIGVIVLTLFASPLLIAAARPLRQRR
jgi:CPA2 family monovalent cation:H+ antiporter-2